MQTDRISGEKPFADAVSDVIKWWRFAPAIDHEACAPAEGEYRTEVIFSGTADQPKIHVVTPKQAKAEMRSSAWKTMKWAKQTPPTYPRDAARSGTEGRVILLVKINPDGNVQAVKTLASYPDLAFEAAAVNAVKHWKMRWLEDPPTEPVCGAQEVYFCMADATGPSAAGCKR